MDMVGLVEWSTRSRPVRRVAVVAVVLLVAAAAGLVGWHFWRQRAVNRESAEAVAAVDHADPGWRLADLEAGRAAVPDDQNGALVILRAADRLPASIAASPSRRLWSVLMYLPPDARLTDAQYSALRADLDVLDQNEVAIVRSLANFPAGRYPTTPDLDFATNRPPQWEAAERVNWVLFPLGLVHAHEGDVAAAVRDGRCLLGLARTFGDEPSGPSQEMRVRFREWALRAVERALAHGEAPAADLAALQAELAREGEYDAWAALARCERAVAHELLSQAERGERSLDDVLNRFNRSYAYLPKSAFDEYLRPGPLGLPPHNRLRLDHAALLDVTTRIIAAARLPPHEQAAVVYQFRNPGEMIGPVLTRITVNKLVNRFDWEQVHRAKLHSAVAALAVERYRLAHGRWPESLADVVPEFLAAVPADPCDGQPLRYRRTADGVVVYSVGPDGIDQGGTFQYEPLISSPDVGCTLWDVSRRHRPPPP